MNAIVLRLTHRIWNREISRLLGRAYGRHWIDSKQYHQLAAMFDPTQVHCEVGRDASPYDYRSGGGAMSWLNKLLRPWARDSHLLSEPQGPCEMTLTARYKVDCRCGTYAGNLGPCAVFEEGANPRRCVYCDHTTECHALVLPIIGDNFLDAPHAVADAVSSESSSDTGANR